MWMLAFGSLWATPDEKWARISVADFDVRRSGGVSEVLAAFQKY